MAQFILVSFWILYFVIHTPCSFSCCFRHVFSPGSSFHHGRDHPLCARCGGGAAQVLGQRAGELFTPIRVFFKFHCCFAAAKPYVDYILRRSDVFLPKSSKSTLLDVEMGGATDSVKHAELLEDPLDTEV